MNEILPPAWRGLTVTVAHTDRSVNQADPLAILQVPGSRQETKRYAPTKHIHPEQGAGPRTLVQCRVPFAESSSSEANL